MRIEMDRQAWNQGFWDGELGRPLDCCPYAVKAAESLSWLSGYIEGKAFRNGFTATPPGSPMPRQQVRPAAEPYAVPLRFTAAGSAAEHRRQVGVKIARRSGAHCLNRN